jgi:hypothetical protein
MKIKILITLVILALNITLIFGRSNTKFTNDRPVENREVCLLPATPRVADYNENVPEPIADYRDLAPVTPLEASFNEEVHFQPCFNDILMILSPSTPAKADFEEDTNYYGITISLNPAAPKEADFEDIL